LKKNIVVIIDELDPIPAKKSPIDATTRFKLTDKTKFPNPHMPNESKIDILRPKLSLKYENPSKPIKIPNGKQNLMNVSFILS